MPGAPNSSSSTDNPGYTPSDGGGGGPGGGGAGPGGQQQTRYGANPPPPPNMGAMPPPDAYGSTASMQSTGSAWYGGDQRLPGIAQVAPNDLPRPMPHHLMTGPLPGQTHGHYITIFDVSPQQGFEGTVISISCELSFPPSAGPDNLSSGPSRVRFVMGNRIVETEISTPIQSKDPYILRAAVPSFSQLHAASTSVPMRLEAINEVHVFESVSLGDFHFLDGKYLTTNMSSPSDAQTAACPSVLASAAAGAQLSQSGSTILLVARSPHLDRDLVVAPHVMVSWLLSQELWYQCVNTQQSPTQLQPLQLGHLQLLSTTLHPQPLSRDWCAPLRWLAALLIPTRTWSAPRPDSRSTVTLIR